MFQPREKCRYGRFSATGKITGKCQIERNISGFGESVSILKNGKLIFSGELLEDCVEDYEELSDGTIRCTILLEKERYDDEFVIGKCLKRFE